MHGFLYGNGFSHLAELAVLDCPYISHIPNMSSLSATDINLR